MVLVNDGYETTVDKKGHGRQREFEDVTLGGGTQVRAHRVTKETEGEVTTPGHETRSVSEGEILVETARPGTYEVYDETTWAEMTSPVVESPQSTDDDDDPRYFEPSDHTAAEVRRFLSRDDVPDAEKDRVRQSEQEGKNRQTAFPRD